MEQVIRHETKGLNAPCDVFDDELNRIADHAELAENDYNIPPIRYIQTGDAKTYRLIAEIVLELEAIETEAKETDKAFNKILKQLGVGA